MILYNDAIMKVQYLHFSDEEMKAQRKKRHLSELRSWLVAEAQLEPNFLIPSSGGLSLSSRKSFPSPALPDLA